MLEAFFYISSWLDKQQPAAAYWSSHDETLLLETKKAGGNGCFLKNSRQLVEHIEMLFCKT